VFDLWSANWRVFVGRVLRVTGLSAILCITALAPKPAAAWSDFCEVEYVQLNSDAYAYNVLYDAYFTDTWAGNVDAAASDLSAANDILTEINAIGADMGNIGC
jgi:hypothetical protein